MKIHILEEGPRGCGFRHSGADGVGVYLMGGTDALQACERLPFPLDCCPTCGAGVKFSRGFTWIVPEDLFHRSREPLCALDSDERPRGYSPNHVHALCPMCSPGGARAGLLWIGEKHYSPKSFLDETLRFGISRRISAVPNEFVVGETLVYLAHKKAKDPLEAGRRYSAMELEILIARGETLKRSPAVFSVFRPTHVDLVVDSADPNKLPGRAIAIKERLGVAARFVKIEKLPEWRQEPFFE